MMLENEVAVVTGSAGGIGRAAALLMAKEGAAVMVADINGEGAERVAAEIMDAGRTAAAYAVDLENEDEVSRLMEATVKRFGTASILYNNAAALGPEDAKGDAEIAGLAQAVWNRQMNVTLRSQFFCCKYAIPLMLARGKGAIVNASSAAARLAIPTWSAYSAAKAGVLALTRSVATQYGKRGIRCNAVIPGMILTSSARDFTSNADEARFLELTLWPRLGEPEDIARAVLFLASDAAAYINGAELVVDGGLTCHIATG